ncbi:hypothetical protein PHMEG_00014302 [Phytophthora megakarya]|uniref:Uncharacterized protein n=1 Tax=Phytophthora megakarya TaxID=4795 RepID=A0A225W445_9STRA|nr:hypothetical protein PHMEG_00014302 [Phytophthora megakarya]
MATVPVPILLVSRDECTSYQCCQEPVRHPMVPTLPKLRSAYAGHTKSPVLCSGAAMLGLYRIEIYAETKTLLLPDQSLLIPAVGDGIAQEIGVQRRALWCDEGHRASLWSPMIRLTHFHEEQSAIKRAPVSRLLPSRLVDVVRLIHSEIDLYEVYPDQWTPVWGTGTFHGAQTMADLDGLCQLAVPDRVQWYQVVGTLPVIAITSHVLGGTVLAKRLAHPIFFCGSHSTHNYFVGSGELSIKTGSQRATAAIKPLVGKANENLDYTYLAKPEFLITGA